MARNPMNIFIPSQMFYLFILLASFATALDAAAYDYYGDIIPVCPEMCKCTLLYDRVLCQGLKLTTLPKNISAEAKSIDLSNNSFASIPGELSQYKELKELILSHNKITHLNANGLKISSLEKLDVSHNHIKKWNSINLPLKHNHSLLELDVSHNNIRDLYQATSYLTSSTLEILKLQNCSIKYISELFLSKLINLKTLILSDNTQLANLYSLTSESIEVLDISNCNFEAINLSKFPNLKSLNLAGNRISCLPQYFLQNIKLEILDLSANAIKSIHENAFKKLPALEELNLSTNVVNDMKSETFVANRNLKTLNISRSYLTQILQLNSTSLRILDLSVNEIQDFSEDSLKFMSSLEYLRVSRNLITKLPDRIRSISLKRLDLSTCQIVDFKKETFLQLKNLEELNLANNKLTGLRISYLPSSLLKLDLNNNPWRCDCYSSEFKDLYYFLYPSIVTSELICQSPENVSGRTWLFACATVWSSRTGNYGMSDHFWLYIILSILIMSMIFCTVMSIRRIYKVKLLRLQQERERQRLDAQERIRRLRMHEQSLQQSQQNAPDPRELVRPPSYAEAIRLPRIDGSYSSLAGSRPSLASISTADLSRKKREKQQGPNNATQTTAASSAKTKSSTSHEAQTSGTSNENESVVTIATSDNPNSAEYGISNHLDLESSSDDEASPVRV